MSITINAGLQVQNEYLQRATENISSENTTGRADKNERKAVLERNVSTFGRIANICYDKSEVYGSTSYSNAGEAESTVDGYNKEASMMECIDMLKDSVTPEDYSQLEEWGLIPDEDNPEAFVSVYERIQIELAAYCEDYDISGLNINTEKMKNVLGSTAMANAVSKANDIAAETSVLSDDVKKYIMGNELEPTLENVYKALHSGVSGSMGNTLGDTEWQQLQGQVESFFETNGIEVNSENLESAKWIISEEMPLTVDNFNKLSALNEVDFSDEAYMTNLEQNIAYTIYFGGSAMATDVTGKAFDMETVEEAVETVQSAMDQDVDYILKNNKKLNIENLKLRIEERKKEQSQKNTQKDSDEQIYTQKSKVLVEARAILTAGSLFMMQKAGVSISYTEITVMIDMSHANNATYAEQLFALDDYIPADSERELLTRTVEIMSGFPSLPIGVAASLYNGTIEYTAEAVYEEGQLMASKFHMASMTYEAVGTEVRSDLGDSITKAFRNIDELLTACGVDVNDKNRRSARVLGYNSIEITAESVEAMNDITTDLDELTENLTPRAAVYLIRNGINPLNTNIRELNDKLVQLNEELGAKNADEKYSEYLWKLEKNKSISKEERDAYIQLYRVINHINRQDGSALGAVSKAGQEMTLANLYTAVKTRQTGSVNKQIDDNTGLFDGTYSEDALTKYMENAYELMNDEELHREYVYERMQDKFRGMEQMETMSEQEFMRFISGMQGVSVNSIYSAMAAVDKQFYKKLMALEDENVIKATDKISDVWQQEGDETVQTDDVSLENTISDTYAELNEALSVENTESTYEKAVTRTNMRQVISFMTGQARNRSYYIPMEISGETTMVHMTIKQGNQSEKGRISVYTETEEGKIAVLMYRKEEEYEVLAATDSEELKDRLEQLCGAEENGNVIVTDRVYDGMWNDMVTNSGREEVSYGELIRQAKSFIHNVLKKI